MTWLSCLQTWVDHPVHPVCLPFVTGNVSDPCGPVMTTAPRHWVLGNQTPRRACSPGSSGGFRGLGGAERPRPESRVSEGTQNVSLKQVVPARSGRRGRGDDEPGGQVGSTGGCCGEATGHPDVARVRRSPPAGRLGEGCPGELFWKVLSMAASLGCWGLVGRTGRVRPRDP